MPLPDAHIHPHATGQADLLVQAHQEPHDLIFHSGWFCPFNQRTWVTLEEKGIAYQYKEVNPYHKSKEFLAVNPKGLVPAIQHHGDALYESIVLSEYLEDAFTETKSLYPKDPKDKAKARIQIDYISKKIIPTFFKLLQNQDKEKEAELRSDLVDSLKELTDHVRGPFYAGDEFGVVDVMIAPFFMRLYILEENRGFKASDVGEKFEGWVKACVNRESLIKTTSDKEHYEEIYDRYLENKAESQMAKETRGEKAHT